MLGFVNFTPACVSAFSEFDGDGYRQDSSVDDEEDGSYGNNDDEEDWE